MKNLKEKEINSLVRSKIYNSKEEAMKEAVEALFNRKPELKREVAIDMYKNKEISLWKAAGMCGLSLESFKELLAERGIKVRVGDAKEESDKRLKKVFEE